MKASSSRKKSLPVHLWWMLWRGPITLPQTPRTKQASLRKNYLTSAQYGYRTDHYLCSYLRAATGPFFHPAGTAAMVSRSLGGESSCSLGYILCRRTEKESCRCRRSHIPQGVWHLEPARGRRVTGAYADRSAPANRCLCDCRKGRCYTFSPGS